MTAAQQKKPLWSSSGLRRTLQTLASKEGSHTELITLYVPPRQTNQRRHQSAARRIRNRKQHQIQRHPQKRIRCLDQSSTATQTLQRSRRKRHRDFLRCLPQEGGGPGTERMETYVIIPPEPIKIFLYRCDSRFHTEHLQEMLREKETYGIILVDASDATIATLQGKRLDIVRQMYSGVTGKTKQVDNRPGVTSGSETCSSTNTSTA